MLIRTGNPLQGLANLQQSLANIAGTDTWFTDSTSNRSGFPPINIFQNGDDYVLVAEIPGIKKEDVDIQVHRNRVRIAGEKKSKYGDKVSVHRSERLFGAFDRTFTTPFQIDPDNVRAEYKDGILALSLSPAEADKPRSINVS